MKRVNRYEITREKFFDTDEREKILKVSKQKAKQDQEAGRNTWPARWMLVHLALYSGLRVAEIADLEIIDLFLDVKAPYIKVTNGKGNKARIVYIDDNLCGHLKEYSKGRRKVEPLFKCTFNSKGKKYTTTTLHRSFKKAIQAAGLRMNLTIHSCRHTYATMLLEKTGNMRYVQKQLGHSSLNITALYADILPEKNGILANMILD